MIKEQPLTREQVNLIIRSKEEKTGMSPFLLGRLTREKYYTFLKNSKSGRTYSLSLDFCRAFHQKMSQLEIEYKWRDKKFTQNFEEMESILKEFKLILRLLLFHFGSILTPTKMTKYEWLLAIAYGSKKKK